MISQPLLAEIAPVCDPVAELLDDEVPDLYPRAAREAAGRATESSSFRPLGSSAR